MNQRQVRHGLAVLVQQNTIFHLTDPDTSVAYYDVNPEALYNLVRTGKILEMVHDKYGDTAKSLVQDVLLLGHIKISDLVNTFKDRRKRGKPANGIVKDEEDEDDDDDDVFGLGSNSNHINGNDGGGLNGLENDDEAGATHQAYLFLARLLAAGILEPVSAMMFQSPTDLKTAIEQEVLKVSFPTGIRGIKQKKELEVAVAERAKEFQQGRTTIKRRLEVEFDHEASVKRRKLLNGSGMANGVSGAGAIDLLKEYVSDSRSHLFKLGC